LCVGEPVDVGDLLVGFELVGLGGGGKDNAGAIGLDTLEERANVRKWLDLGQVALFQDITSAFAEACALLLQLLLAQKHRHELVAALADLAADRGELDVVSNLLESVDPGLRMKVDGIDQCSIHVEDDSL
jgi:hypothetical protein